MFEKILKNAIISANIDVFDMASKDEKLSGMGTTVVAAIISGNEAVIAHAGDSRIYLVNDALTQLTKDHSVVQTLIETGKITQKDAKNHPRKNIITRAIGAESEIVVDTDIITLEKGNTLLLCTDGLTNYVVEDKILSTFKEKDIALVAETLVDLANKGGGGDNITVVTLTL